MLELSKKILLQVRFDKSLFRKELKKSINWITKKEIVHLKIWALTSFSEYKKIILDVFDGIV